ncbi:hypothetical protein HEP84_47215 [Streptomyces sp. RLB1-33]|nr:hypothetical protein [Streptomyces sp. RLB1-33]QIY75504.1 hypothetical protein HEP84_47215 [Streptomyces sp. RLB1-33]
MGVDGEGEDAQQPCAQGVLLAWVARYLVLGGHDQACCPPRVQELGDAAPVAAQTGRNVQRGEVVRLVHDGPALPGGEVRQGGRAHQLITEDERLLPTARDKTRGVFLAYRAASCLDLKEPEPAAAAATQSLLLARRIGAPRCVALVDDLLPRFQPHQHAQGVSELLQLAAA